MPRFAAFGLSRSRPVEVAPRPRRPLQDLEVVPPPEGHVFLQTIGTREESQAGRHVVLVNPGELARLGLHEDDVVDLVRDLPSGGVRRVAGFRVVSYPTARGWVAAYFPDSSDLAPEVDAGDAPPALLVRLERA